MSHFRTIIATTCAILLAWSFASTASSARAEIPLSSDASLHGIVRVRPYVANTVFASGKAKGQILRAVNEALKNGGIKVETELFNDSIPVLRLEYHRAGKPGSANKVADFCEVALMHSCKVKGTDQELFATAWHTVVISGENDGGVDATVRRAVELFVEAVKRQNRKIE